VIATIANASSASNLFPPEDDIWIQRRWEIKYVIFVEPVDDFAISIRASKRSNDTATKKDVYLFARAQFIPTQVPNATSRDQIALLAIKFDKKGHARTASRGLNGLKAQRTQFGDLAFENKTPGGKPLYLAEWSQGIPGEITFSPAVCEGADGRRYSASWDKDDYAGGFGCREWTAQLYDSDRPYIDVTSYASDGPFIGQFVGWSRFEDPSKPVIGLQGHTWLCLYDCPAGEKPGVIADMTAWTARHHFPMPERPPRQPLYPDADYPDYWEE
jgi:hypothetical protein